MKKIISIFLIGLMLFWLAACGDSDSAPADGNPFLNFGGKDNQTDEGGPGSGQEPGQDGGGQMPGQGGGNEQTPAGGGQQANDPTDGGEQTGAGDEQTPGQSASGDEQTAGGALEILHPLLETNELTLTRPNSYEIAATAYWMTIRLTEEEAAKWPALARTLKKLAEDMDKSGNKSFEEMKDFMDDYMTDMEEGELPEGETDPEWYLNPDSWPYYMNMDTETKLHILRSDSAALSVLEDYYSYMGGAHPYYAYSGYSFDTQTGKELRVEDVVTDTAKLNEILHDKLMSEFADIDLWEATVTEHLEKCKSGEYHYSWVLDTDCVTFFFNPYELTYFAAGMQIIHVPFAEYPELFVGKYAQSPEEYVKMMITGEKTVTDIDHDGKPETVSIQVQDVGNDPDHAGEMRADIAVNGKTSHFYYEQSYDTQSYLVRTQTGTYLYNGVYNWAGWSFYVYDLSDGRIKGHPKDVYGSIPNLGYIYEQKILDYGIKQGNMIMCQETFTDPNRFHLLSNLCALSSVIGEKTYHVGADGLPVAEEKMYDLTEKWILYSNDGYGLGECLTFTTKQSLEMKLVDENGNVTEKNKTVPKGTALRYIATDGQSLADFELEDGSIVRAPIKVDQWPHLICGVDIEKALDGLFFSE